MDTQLNINQETIEVFIPKNQQKNGDIQYIYRYCFSSKESPFICIAHDIELCRKKCKIFLERHKKKLERLDNEKNLKKTINCL